MHDYIFLLLRLIIIFVFIWSVGSKLFSLQSFFKKIEDFQILSSKFSKISGRVIIISEVTAVLLLFFGGRFMFLGFLLVTILLLLFSAVLIFSLIRKIQISCGCFGNSKDVISKYDVIRNVILVFISISGFLLSKNIDYQNPFAFQSIGIVLLSFIFAVIIVNTSELLKILK